MDDAELATVRLDETHDEEVVGLSVEDVLVEPRHTVDGADVAEAVQEGRLEPGDLLLMVAFGAGLTWAAAAVRW